MSNDIHRKRWGVDIKKVLDINNMLTELLL